jgi:ribonuclease E
MKDKLKTDRARIQVGRISGFGLMEMSRQRLRPGMIEATTQPCQACHGTGLIRSDDNLALSILRQIEEEGTRKRSREVLITAPVGIANFLMNQKREHIAQIEARYGLSVRIEGDPMLVSPDFSMEKFKTATRVVTASAEPVVSVDTSIMDQVDSDDADSDGDATSDQSQAAANGEQGAGDGDGEGRPKRRRRRRRRSRNKNGSGEGQNAEAASSGENVDGAAPASDGAETPVAANHDAPVAEQTADQPAAAETAEAEPKETKPKRTRSRSRKPKADDAQADASSEAPEPAAEPVAEDAAEDAKPKRKRASRAKKPKVEAKAVEEDTADAQVAEAPAAAVEEPAPEAAPEPVPQPEPEPVPQPEPEPVTAEEAEDVPAKPKRKGWWSLGG